MQIEEFAEEKDKLIKESVQHHKHVAALDAQMAELRQSGAAEHASTLASLEAKRATAVKESFRMGGLYRERIRKVEAALQDAQAARAATETALAAAQAAVAVAEAALAQETAAASSSPAPASANAAAKAGLEVKVLELQGALTTLTGQSEVLAGEKAEAEAQVTLRSPDRWPRLLIRCPCCIGATALAEGSPP